MLKCSKQTVHWKSTRVSCIHDASYWERLLCVTPPRLVRGEPRVLTRKFLPSPFQEQPLFVQLRIALESSTTAALSLKHWGERERRGRWIHFYRPWALNIPCYYREWLWLLYSNSVNLIRACGMLCEWFWKELGKAYCIEVDAGTTDGTANSFLLPIDMNRERETWDQHCKFMWSNPQTHNSSLYYNATHIAGIHRAGIVNSHDNKSKMGVSIIINSIQ